MPTRRLFTLACASAAVLAGALLHGCAGTPPGVGGEPPRRVDASTTEYDLYEALGYRLAWRGFPVVPARRAAKFVVADENVIVFQDNGDTVTLLDTATGMRRWATEVDSPLTRFVGNTIAGDRVYCASDNELFVLDIRTGELLERHNLAVVVTTRPLVMGSMAFFGSAPGELLGHNLISTYKQWGYRLRNSITARPVRTGPYVAAVSQAGDVLIVNPANGSSVGRASIFGGLSNDPVADDTTVYIASTDQSVYAIANERGSIRWRHRAEQPIVAQPTLHDGSLYVHIPGRGLVCFDATNGAIRWESVDARGEVIAKRAGRLLVWDADRRVVRTLDPERGDIVETVELRDVFTLVTDTFVDGVLYSVNPGGRISRWNPRL
ncbi:MAG: hypothetical protein EA379_02495 [Phycisphaerales bacterium]|nr:MAG: hypothetical protein EA379_02495 [Phycisphaerales bacterium]